MLAYEQRCGFRRKGSIIPLRHCRGNFDIPTRLKSLLIRRDVYKHLAGLFKQFDKEILAYMEPEWYQNYIGSEEEAEGATEQAEDNDGDLRMEVSAYTSKVPLMKFCTKLGKGHYELSLCKVAILGY